MDKVVDLYYFPADSCAENSLSRSCSLLWSSRSRTVFLKHIADTFETPKYICGNGPSAHKGTHGEKFARVATSPEVRVSVSPVIHDLVLGVDRPA